MSGCTQVHIMCIMVHIMFTCFQMCMFVAAQKLYMCIHSCVHAHRGTARARKNSSHLHSVYSVAAVATNCQAERREGRDEEGDGNSLTRCEIITVAYGCRKPYIRGVYAYEITTKGLIGQQRVYSQLPFVINPAVYQ